MALELRVDAYRLACLHGRDAVSLRGEMNALHPGRCAVCFCRNLNTIGPAVSSLTDAGSCLSVSDDTWRENSVFPNLSKGYIKQIVKWPRTPYSGVIEKKIPVSSSLPGKQNCSQTYINAISSAPISQLEGITKQLIDPRKKKRACGVSD